MPVTNAGTPPFTPTLPSDPALSKLCYDFSSSQPWVVGVAVSCERCGFAKTLKSCDLVPTDLSGLHAAYHFVYKDGSRSGWGNGVYVCPGCGKYLFIERELPQ